MTINRTTVTVRVTLDTAAPTISEVANAVRRAAGSLDKAVLINGTPVVAKGVSFTPRALKAPTAPTYNPVREWAVQNGHPEVAGKRGRLSREIHAAYEAATK